MTKLSTSQRINKIIADLLGQGWWLKSHNRHPRLASPDGKIVITIPTTPSDRRAELNWISQSRRAGAPI